MNLKELFPTLKEDEQGILRSPEKITVSFPKEGNETCFGLEDRSFWFRHRNEVSIAAIKRFTPPAGPMLDIEGGNGFVTRRLLDKDFRQFCSNRERLALSTQKSGGAVAMVTDRFLFRALQKI